MVVIEPRRATRIIGTGGHSRWLPPLADLPELSTRSARQIVEHDVDDQVVVVEAGITLRELNDALAMHQQCIPYFPCVESLMDSTLGGLVSVALPHLGEAQYGTWRHWVIGMTIQKADGTVAKAGSKAVKSVAGYDVHKMFVGARGSLGLIQRLILRTYPLRALKSIEGELKGAGGGNCRFVHRVLLTDLDELLSLTPGALVDRETGTVYTETAPAKRFHGDWVISAEHAPTVTPLQPLMLTSKRAFDPDHLLNPGIMGGF